MPRHKGSKDLKPRARQRATRPRGIPPTEGIAHQPRREFIVSSSVRLACEKYLANPQPHHSPRRPIFRPNAAWDRPACPHNAFKMKPTPHPKPFQSQLWPYLNEIRRLRKGRATWPAIAAELGQRGVTLDPWTIRRFFKRAQSAKVPLGFEDPQYDPPAARRGKLPPIGNRRDPLLEVSPERSPWTPVGGEEDIYDEARRRMREEQSSKPKIVRPDRPL
jgi:hypothetical protein